MTAEMTRTAALAGKVYDFWNVNPCGEHQIGAPDGDLETFFARYDCFRYGREGHILQQIAATDFCGKRVLEIGLGLGADAEQIIRRGGIWSGVDLTPASVERVKQRFSLRHLPYEDVRCASVLALPYPDNSFDVVFSHGVLHHVPEIMTAQREIARVLKPEGRLIMMVYARRSLNYLLSIAVLRRLGLAGCYLTGLTPSRKIAGHIRNAHEVGLLRYLAMKNFIHRNTDGPDNPYSKVYRRRDLDADFPDFTVIKTKQVWMHAPPLPVGLLRPLSALLGWHLWAQLAPNKAAR